MSHSFAVGPELRSLLVEHRCCQRLELTTDDWTLLRLGRLFPAKYVTGVPELFWDRLRILQEK
jgi:hypothetical protein